MSTYYKTSCSVLRNSCPEGGGKGVMISPVGWLTSLANKSKLRPVRAGSHLSAIMTRNLFNLNDLPWPVSSRSHCSHITGPNNTNANQQQGLGWGGSGGVLNFPWSVIVSCRTWCIQNKEPVVDFRCVKWVTELKNNTGSRPKSLRWLRSKPASFGWPVQGLWALKTETSRLYLYRKI